MGYRFQLAVFGLCLVLSGLACAQMSIGEYTKITGGANISVGYGGSFSDGGASSHNTSIGGNGDFSGYYYVPTFLSFSVQPYLNRTQDNSTYASVANSSGLISSANFFTGSRFPGTLSYIRHGSSTELVGVGNGGYTGDGSGQSWNIGWSALLPDLPTLSINYGHAGQRSSVYGVDGDYRSSSNTLSLTSTYSLAGFGLTGRLAKSAMHFESPGFLAASSESSANSNNMSLSANRRVFWHGNLQLTALRNRNGTDTASTDSENVSHSYTATVSMIPVGKLAISGGANYNDNLNGVLNQYFIDQGSAPVFKRDNSSSNSIGMYAGASLEVLPRLTLTANGNHSVQHWFGKTHTQEQFSGTANYTFVHGFLRSFRLSGGLSDSATDAGNRGLGAIAIVNFDRKFGAWLVRGNYSYSHTLQTLVGITNDSTMTYTASLTHKLGRNLLYTSYYGSHTGVQAAGGANKSNNFAASYAAPSFNISGNYGRSDGYSLLTSTGLVAGTGNLPTEALTGESIVVFNGEAYSVGGTWRPIRKMEFTINYSSSDNSTLAGDKSTFGSTNVVRTRFRYPMRQLTFDFGMTHLRQTISAEGARPVAFTSYYFGISRWFNLF